MRFCNDDGRRRPMLPRFSGSRRSLGRFAAGASSLVLLTGPSDLGIAPYLPSWSARLVSGGAGLAGGAAAWRSAVRGLPPPGPTPAQALSQLRRDLDLASTAAPRELGPAREAEVSG